MTSYGLMPSRDEAPQKAERRRILESDNVATFSKFRPLR
jgi:hypothetical protein